MADIRIECGCGGAVGIDGIHGDIYTYDKLLDWFKEAHKGCTTTENTNLLSEGDKIDKEVGAVVDTI